MHLFCFGLGYTAQYLLNLMQGELGSVAGTCRSADKIRELSRKQIRASLFEDVTPEKLADVTHILITIPPFEDLGDMVQHYFGEVIAALPNLRWLGYLSTTGVYGDHDGGWVDESTPPHPYSARAKRRLEVEKQWLELWEARGTSVHIFRLAAIYGPYRNALMEVGQPHAKIIDKPGQFFNRIHVQDIAGILAASMRSPTPGAVYNLCDDTPSSAREVQEYAAKLLKLPPPPVVAYENAILSVMRREFYATNRKVRNDKVKAVLAYKLLYPSYKEGLEAIFHQHQYM